MNRMASIVGCCINQDGRSATLTAPNGPAQTACTRGSMYEANLTAPEIAIAECHGTGTALGDPIEVGALRAALVERDLPLVMTSAKSNTGHLEACAGSNGLCKCILMVSAST